MSATKSTEHVFVDTHCIWCDIHIIRAEESPTCIKHEPGCGDPACKVHGEKRDSLEGMVRLGPNFYVDEDLLKK